MSVGGIVSYKVKINSPGTYLFGHGHYSTGSEDNGVHIGINDEWPESGARIQWCENKTNRFGLRPNVDLKIIAEPKKQYL